MPFSTSTHEIFVFGDETDEANFLEIVGDTVNGMLLEIKVVGVSFVKIRDWFGPKWLGFSGKKMGAFGVRDQRGAGIETGELFSGTPRIATRTRSQWLDRMSNLTDISLMILRLTCGS